MEGQISFGQNPGEAQNHRLLRRIYKISKLYNPFICLNGLLTLKLHLTCKLAGPQGRYDGVHLLLLDYFFLVNPVFQLSQIFSSLISR